MVHNSSGAQSRGAPAPIDFGERDFRRAGPCFQRDFFSSAGFFVAGRIISRCGRAVTRPVSAEPFLLFHLAAVPSVVGWLAPAEQPSQEDLPGRCDRTIVALSGSMHGGQLPVPGGRSRCAPGAWRSFCTARDRPRTPRPPVDLGAGGSVPFVAYAMHKRVFLMRRSAAANALLGRFSQWISPIVSLHVSPAHSVARARRLGQYTRRRDRRGRKGVVYRATEMLRGPRRSSYAAGLRGRGGLKRFERESSRRPGPARTPCRSR